MELQAPALFELEALLPLEVIRAHTRTNDIATVTDEQLASYRAAGFEAAQAYTGLWLGGDHMITEFLGSKKRKRFRLKYPSRDGRVHVHMEGVAPYTEYLNPGARAIRLREVQHLDAFNCCDPCAGQTVDRVMYRTGFKCMADFPEGIKTGVLRYIAYTIANPGDISVTYTQQRAETAARQYLNNAIVASGAAEEWDRYRPKATV